MRSRPLLVVLAVLSFSLLVSADEWNKSFNLNGRPDLRVKTGDGNIRVEPWDKDTVEIRVTTQNWKIGEDGLQILDHQSGNQVSLDVPTSRNEVHFGWGEHPRRRVDIEIRMPRLARIDLHTGDGNIVICNTAGTPYKASYGNKRSPDCGHVYTTSSSSKPDQRFTVTATSDWVITWAGAGQTGTVRLNGLTRSVQIAIGEAQVLVQ